MAQDGYARAITPIHTLVDGDTIFALATGEKAGDADVTRIGALAAEVMADAILRAVRHATCGSRIANSRADARIRQRCAEPRGRPTLTCG